MIGERLWICINYVLNLTFAYYWRIITEDICCFLYQTLLKIVCDNLILLYIC